MLAAEALAAVALVALAATNVNRAVASAVAVAAALIEATSEADAAGNACHLTLVETVSLMLPMLACFSSHSYLLKVEKPLFPHLKTKILDIKII